MRPVLFVSNGHGEIAIADRIAFEVRALAPDMAIDHLALVGDVSARQMHDVGPRKAMPSGGLIAMGNLRNIARDVTAGLLTLTFAQYRFLRSVRGRYGVAVAIGDVYALAMTLAVRTRTTFVGTAKSIGVAPYGRFEERILRAADVRFVRDAPTARRLQEHGLVTEPANVIVDLLEDSDDTQADEAVADFAPALALLPGSREKAYADAAFLLEIVRELAAQRTGLGAVLSIAPNLAPDRFAQAAAAHGWEVLKDGDESVPFALRLGDRTVVRAWRGPVGAVLTRVELVLGQAGTANEIAAAAGVPVVAFERRKDRKRLWYRRRQSALLGDALIVLPNELSAAIAETRDLLADPPRLARMAAIGRERMGPSGGARRIAERIVAIDAAARDVP